MQRVQPGRRRSWAETHQIVVRYVIRQRDETCPQTLSIVEVMELASGKLRYGIRGIGAQRVACGNKGHGGQSKRRGELADAGEHLLVVVPVVLGIGSLSTETAMRGTWFAAIQL